MVKSAKFYGSWVVFNKLFILLVFSIIIVLIIQRAANRSAFNESIQISLYFIIWILGWIGIFLPWSHELSPRYMLVSELGMALLGGILFAIVLQKNNNFLTGLIVSIYLASIFFGLLNLFNQSIVYYSWNKVNGQMIKYLADVTSPGQKIYFNFPHYNEIVFETNLHLKEFYNISDVDVQEIPKSKDIGNNSLIVNPIGQDSGLFSRVGWDEGFVLQRKANLEKLKKENQIVFLKQFQFDNHLILQQPLSFKILPIEVSYGWEVYSFLPEGFIDIGNEATDSEYIDDGFYSPENNRRWTNGYGKLSIKLDQLSSHKISMRLYVPDYNDKSDIPLQIKLGENEVFSKVLDPGYSEISFTVPPASSNKLTIISDTFVPFQVSASSDKRTLGILLDWIKIEKD